MDLVSKIRNNPKYINNLYVNFVRLTGKDKFTVRQMVDYLKFRIGLNDSSIMSLVEA